MINTDPAGFNSESTGTFRVQPLNAACIAADAGITVERLEATTHVDEYGHRGDCDGCAAPTCGPPETMCLPPVTGYIAPFGPAPVSLVYAHSDGYTFTRVDTENLLTHSRDGSDGDHRERLLLRALLQHTLAMLNGEDVS